jgi:hypothetical protein
MNNDLEIDSGGTRECASGVAATGARVANGVSRSPIPVMAPRWATSDAASMASDVARRRLTAVGADIAETARQIIAATIGYEAADERAASRLRGTR